MKLRSPRSSRCAPSPVELPSRHWDGRMVMVAVRRDAAGRELLAWALAKVAAAGDRVVALHVTAARVAEDCLEMESSAAESLASVLGAYDGFCSLKKITLELRVCHGSSVKKTLVREASSYGATHLIVGVTKNSRHFGSSTTAVAKYCAKRLPHSCSVLAVSNGTIVYHGNAVQEELNPCSALSPLRTYSAMVETPRRIYKKILEATATTGEKTRDDSVIGQCRSLRRNASMSAPVSPIAAAAPVPAKSSRRELPEVAAGWPLLRKDFMPSSPECTEVSVVEWAMRLPSRCSSRSSVDSDRIYDLPSPSPSPLRRDSSNSSTVIDEADKPVPEELVLLREKYSSKYTVFSYVDLARITSGFSADCIVGKGGNSLVYRGCSEDGKQLAVKVLKRSEEAMKDFISEIDIISSIDHKNAMSLVGFCLDHGKLMLVYEYMRRGTLEQILQSNDSRFGWPERFKVAAGVARALDHLHGDGNERPVIHRDVKSSNILISEDSEPKLCDFGLALWAADAASQVADDDVAGTFGYLAPEYFMHGKVSDKIDVYAFGVVLLELISGRKPVSSGGPKGQESLVMWANSIVQGGKLMDLVDPSLPTNASHAGEVERMTLAAALCIRRSPQHRPSIANVLMVLEGDVDAVRWAKSQLGLSGGDDDDDDNEYCTVASAGNAMQSYIKLALLDMVDDDATSVASSDFIPAGMSLEEYMKGRWSRSSSFD